MSALAPARVGWCPGALAPMASGDGLIVRVKPRGGRLTCEQAGAIALASQRYGNGALDFTARANLQIRGLTEGALPDLVEALDRAGLVDPNPASEAVRNVVSSPLAGLDRTATLDIRPLVGALESRLVEDAALHAMPAKFGFVVEDGGRLGLSDVAADVRFEAFCDDAGPAFAVRLGGAGNEAAARCRPEDIAETAAALVQVFLAARHTDGDLRRMRHLVARIGAATVLRRARLDPCSLPSRAAPASPEHFIGCVECRPPPSPLAEEGGAKRRMRGPVERWTPLAGAVFLGAAAPFGRLSGRQLELLARIADENGAAELRLTPWRAILLPGLRAEDAPRVAERCARAGLILDPVDPRLHVAACTGAPGCHRGTTPVLAHAARLAARLGRSRSEQGIVRLHVSGCSKGCAHAGKAPLTLVADNGWYGVVVDGCASDQAILRGLSFEEAAACVKAAQRERRG